MPIKSFTIYFKKHKINPSRKINSNYNGLLRVCVKQSTNLNRKIMGWISGVTEFIGE